MSRKAKSASWWVVGLVAAGILGLGAREAFATSPASACPNDGYNTVGSQPSLAACWSACLAVHGLNLYQAVWNPSTTCCKCLL